MYATILMLPFLQLLYLIVSPQINSDLKYIDQWLKANKVSLNVANTEFMVISSRQKLQSLNDCTMNIHIKVIHYNIQKLQSLNEHSYRRRPNKPKQSKQISRAYHWWKSLVEGPHSWNL